MLPIKDVFLSLELPYLPFEVVNLFSSGLYVRIVRAPKTVVEYEEGVEVKFSVSSADGGDIKECVMLHIESTDDARTFRSNELRPWISAFMLSLLSSCPCRLASASSIFF